MPIHDWTRVDAGTFHDFHCAWNTHIKEALNDGILPTGFYAMAEQVVSRRQGDVIALRVPSRVPVPDSGRVVQGTEPEVSFRTRPDPSRRPRRTFSRRRRLAIRHVSGDQVIAIIEVVSPANKDRTQSVRQFAGKLADCLEAGTHALVIDLLPPGQFDPGGMHGAVWSNFDSAGYVVPADSPLTLASYEWDNGEPEAFIEPTAVGRTLVDMPLFLSPGSHVKVPLESTYMAAVRGSGNVIRARLEAPE